MNKLARVFHGIGFLFLALSLGLTIYNIWQDRQAKESSDKVLQMLLEDIPEITPSISEENSGEPNIGMDEVLENLLKEEAMSETVPDYILNPQMEMPVQNISGLDYIGWLEIPDLSLSLPILSDWNYPKLKISPCRYTGSAYQDNLVIMAHNYASHFGKLKNLSYGQLVTFTDMDGNIFTYQVVTVEILQPTQVEEMIAGLGDLTLFTCTLGGGSRVTVGCERI